jgi:hypothetical protein
VSPLGGPPAGHRPGGGSGVGLAVWLLLAPARLLVTDLGRRLATVAVLTTLFVGVMSLLYDHAEHPTANARPAATATRPPAPPATAQPSPGPAAPRPATRPEPVAVAWYAKRLGVPAGRVKALGSQRLGTGRIRVLVLAQTPDGRQATVWVPLRRTHAGWTVSS